MKSYMKKTARISLFVCAVLCLALILVQFLPYWTAPDDPNYKPPTETTAAPKSTEAATQAPTEAATQAPTEAETQAPTEAETQAPTEAVTEPATEATTDAATDATTDTATEAPTAGADDEATEEPTETTKKKKKKNPLEMLQTYTPPEQPLEPETDPISIFSFLVLPEDHPYIACYLGAAKHEIAETIPIGPVINSLAGTFCIVMLLGLVSIIFIILKSDKLWISVWPTVVGIGSLIGYLTQPVWAMGSLHVVLIALSAALTVAALIPLCIWFYSFKFWFMDPKKLNQK